MCIIDKYAEPQPKWGETINGSCAPVLEQLGLWQAFLKQGHLPSYSCESRWTNNHAQTIDSIKSPYGQGWHIDRSAFEHLLRYSLDATGMEVKFGQTIGNLSYVKDLHWCFSLTDGSQSTCSLLIDATGRQRALVKKLSAAKTESYPQLALTHIFRCAELAKHQFEIEASELGWWYQAPLPSGDNLVTLITDRSLWSRHRQDKNRQWLSAFRRTGLYSKGKRWKIKRDTISTTNADVALLGQLVGNGWLAVGDSAMSLDPLAGQGIEMALRGGLKAAQIGADLLSGRKASCVDYSTALNHYFHQHIQQRAKFYQMETRWQSAPFWKNRQQTNI